MVGVEMAAVHCDDDVGCSVSQVMDMLVEQTHSLGQEFFNPDGSLRFTDTRLDEQERGISLKMVPMSLVLQSSTGKSFLVNLIDTPGAQEQSVLIKIASRQQVVAVTCQTYPENFSVHPILQTTQSVSCKTIPQFQFQRGFLWQQGSTSC